MLENKYFQLSLIVFGLIVSAAIMKAVFVPTWTTAIGLLAAFAFSELIQLFVTGIRN